MSEPIIVVENLWAGFQDRWILKNVNLTIPKGKITAIMGPSGCGKTTLLRCINRLHQLFPNAKIKGRILFKGRDIYHFKPSQLRRKIVMVSQKPTPFPDMNIRENVLAGYILNGIKLKEDEKEDIVERSLKMAYLWDEVKDRLNESPLTLSGGQIQRLCIARALALNPEALLLDEPTSALDKKTTHHLEKLLTGLTPEITVLIITHDLHQADRIANNLTEWSQITGG